MIEKFKFENINISSKGPFHEGQNLKFSSGANIISAGNGLGKTTIFNSLIDSFYFKYELECNERNLIKVIMFIDREFVSLDDLIFILKSNNVLTSTLEIVVTEFLIKIMRDKFSVGVNKFSRYRENLGQISVKIEDSGAVKILIDASEDISHNFQAADEQMALLFSFVLAARKILNVNFPLICDGFFYGHSEVVNGVISELMKQDIQLILLGHPGFWEELQIKPTVELTLDADRKHSIIQYY
jgi:hypothetical protein